MPSNARPSKPVIRHQRVRRGNKDDAHRVRDQILAAAMALFEAGGADAVSIRAIAASLGMSPMAPYRYFADKAALLNALWAASIDELLHCLQSSHVVTDPVQLRHRAMIRAYLDYWGAHVEQYRLLYLTQGQGAQAGAGSANPLQVPSYAAIVKMGRELTLELAQSLGAPPDRVALASDMRVAMMFGYLQAAHFNRRFPWAHFAQLRDVFVEQVALAVERVLVDGAGAASPPAAPSPA